MSESLRNDGRIWVPLEPGDTRAPNDIPEDERDYYLERQYPAFGNLVPRDVASRAAMRMIDEDRGVGPLRNGVYLDFEDSIARLGKAKIEERYGNLFEMYERITDEDPYSVPMRIYPAPHYTMGGLWVDYNLMTTVAGLYALGEANFSDHGANRLGASALMQGVADGYFIISYTISAYLADWLNTEPVATDDPVFAESVDEVNAQVARLLSIDGERSVEDFHRQLGKIMIEYVGLARDRDGLNKAIQEIKEVREEFWSNLKLLGTSDSLNQALEAAGRMVDFLEMSELMAIDALNREESCGGHFRLEHQTEDGEARRDDKDYAYVAAWEWKGENWPQTLHKEPLEFDYVELSQRNYK
jgi:succinate dehydrogenase / fumarate reductase flavoprotein subunit